MPFGHSAAAAGIKWPSVSAHLLNLLDVDSKREPLNQVFGIGNLKRWLENAQDMLVSKKESREYHMIGTGASSFYYHFLGPYGPKKVPSKRTRRSLLSFVIFSSIPVLIHYVSP